MAAEYKCETCGAIYWRNQPGPCFADGCSGHLKRIMKPRVMKRCEVCGKSFVVLCDGQRACAGKCTAKLREKEGRQRALDALRKAREESARQARFRGPYGECWEYAEPLNPPRKCHTCGGTTRDYNCDKCKARQRVNEGVTGLSGEAELFSGALIETGRVR